MALYIIEFLDGIKCQHETEDISIDSLWVRIRRESNICDVRVGVCYQPCTEEHEEDEEDNSLQQQAEVS